MFNTSCQIIQGAKLIPPFNISLDKRYGYREGSKLVNELSSMVCSVVLVDYNICYLSDTYNQLDQRAPELP